MLLARFQMRVPGPPAAVPGPPATTGEYGCPVPAQAGKPLAFAVLALALALASCASGGPPATSCSPSAPEQVPPMAEALDVDAVVQWLAEAELGGPSTDAGAPPTAVLAVSRDRRESGARTPWVRVVESDFPDDLAEELVETVLRALPPPADRAGAADQEEEARPPLPLFRLRVEAGLEPVLSVGPATSCRPGLVNGPEVQSLLNPLAGRFPRGGRVVVDLFVDEGGRVSDHSLREGTSNPALTAALVDIARQMRFRPAEIDGYPVGAWVRMPVRLQVR